MSDTVKTVGQAVDQKAPNELVRSERHHLWRIATSVIAPTERNGCLVGADQATVGDGDAVRVAAEISEDMPGRAEWWLRKDNPVLTTKLPNRCCKGVVIIEPGERARKAQPACQMSGLKPFEEKPPENAGEHMDGQEEARSAGEPALTIHERAAGNETVDMGMMGERLSPGMEDGKKADLATKMPWIRSNDLQRRRHRIEQDRIDDGLVVEGDLCRLRRHREHDMEVRHRQQIGLAIC